jgi:hypothetical protein
MKTHWKKQFNYNFMGTYSLPDEKDLVVTIRATDIQEVSSPNGKSDECLVVYFEESDKPMILNRTNARTIEKLAGSPYVEEWPGTRIQLYVAKDIKAFNTTTDALRIRDFHPRPVSLDTAPVIEAINACNTIEALLKYYFSLSKDLRSDDEVIHAKNLRKETLQSTAGADSKPAGADFKSVPQNPADADSNPVTADADFKSVPQTHNSQPTNPIKPHPKPTKRKSTRKPQTNTSTVD